MKTQTRGAYADSTVYIAITHTAVFLRHLSELAYALASRDFKNKRENGEDQDNPKNLSPDNDGKYTWIKGKCIGDEAYGVKGARGYEYELQYDAGTKDKEYFEAKDRNYLTRILNDKKLFELEPDVWYLREADAARGIDVADIGKWWSQKLKLPNIGELLEKAEAFYTYHAVFSFWKEAPKEICQLIAEDFVTDKKLGGLIDEKTMLNEQPQTPMSKIL
jgi:hypothetical protein